MLNAKHKRKSTSSKKINLGQSVPPYPKYGVVNDSSEGEFHKLPIVCLKSILGQRITSEKKAKAFLKKAGGWDWSLYSPILVARIKRPDGGYDYYVYDGDHRLLMYVMVFGAEATIPCYVIDASSKREVARRFNLINARRRTAVTKEQQFICDYHAGEAEVVALEKTLHTLGIRVADDITRNGDNLHEVPVGSSEPAISANALRQCVKTAEDGMVSGKAFEQAVKLLKKSFPTDIELRSELVQALTLFFKIYAGSFAKKRLRIGNAFAQFEMFFGAAKALFTSQKSLADQWKRDGGRVHHKEKECIALGMLQAFLRSPQGNMLTTHFKTKPLETLIGNINS
tara:strand:- start:374 stop:1396 length:1023 start_codon:yes stop_codon:yes gene_type:complete